MFYGKVIKADETVVPEIKDGYSVIHLSRACLNNPEDEGKLYVQVEDANGCYNICCLQKNVCEDTALDIFLMLDNEVKLKTSGSKNEVHIVGYYEVSFGQDHLDDEDEEDEELEGEDDEYENEEVRMLTRKNTLKNSLANGFGKKKKKNSLDEDDETNVGNNDDEDDEDDEDDDDDDDDDEDEEGEDDDDDEDDEDDDDEEDDDEDDEEDEEDDDDEDDDDGTKNKGDKKKNGPKKNKNKRALDNKNDGPSKKSKLFDESQYEKDLVAFLKKNGKCKLPELGKVKKPEGLKMKLGFFIKKHSNVFKFDADSQVVSLKNN
ncbi:Mitotic apparatus protein p62, putative [Plasmodium vivax]|uniref:Mitotic apparatus protein p62, putative n=2 Tax=Plasmodium vivax TaxID=5855 RepID=A5JZP7_PLAVS|nr:Mitotic apparatus protein p62, putative [Plasmodium vivax]EDL47458.1 Mitotic apparatus protein p62, putative [Plasmodium vivax]KMZ84347.1 mitotic apparatus protein p62 [Plasmodium vivax Brazil I]|eukprot:XP_001617185.1 Mitotic apparatus protein p62 [Plasmodium vivax Sal-1]